MKKKHLILGLCAAVLIAAGSLVALTGCDDDNPTEPAPPPEDCPQGPPQRPALPTLTSMIETVPEGEMIINAADTPLQSLRVVRSGKEIAIYITLQ